MANSTTGEEAELQGNYSDYAEGLITYWGYDVGTPLRVALQHEKVDDKALLHGSPPTDKDSVDRYLLANCEMLTECRGRESVTLIVLYDPKRQLYTVQATIFLDDEEDLLSLISSSPQPSIELATSSLLHISAVVLSHLIDLKAFSPSARKGDKHKEPTTYHRQLLTGLPRPYAPTSVPSAAPSPIPRPLPYQAATSVPGLYQPPPPNMTRAMVPVPNALQPPTKYQSRPLPTTTQAQGIPDSVLTSFKPASGISVGWKLFGWMFRKPTPAIVESKME